MKLSRPYFVVSWLTVCKSTDSFELSRKLVTAGLSHVLGGGTLASSSSYNAGGDGGDDVGGVSASGLKSSSNGLSLSNSSIP